MHFQEKLLNLFIVGLVSLVLFLITLFIFLDNDPSYVALGIFGALFLASFWWLILIFRYKPAAVEGEAQQEGEPWSRLQKIAAVAAVVGFIPWIFLWVLVIAPLVGLGQLSIKMHLFFILGLPIIATWLWSKNK
jgi:accessory gene regulator protein AgrB